MLAALAGELGIQRREAGARGGAVIVSIPMNVPTRRRWPTWSRWCTTWPRSWPAGGGAL